MQISPATQFTSTTPPVGDFHAAYALLSDVQKTVQGFADLYARGESTTSRELTNAAMDAKRAADMFAPLDWPQAQAAHSVALEGAHQLHVAAAQARGEFGGNVDANVQASVESVSQQFAYVLHINGH